MHAGLRRQVRCRGGNCLDPWLLVIGDDRNPVAGLVLRCDRGFLEDFDLVRNLLTTSVARASPSTSSAMMSNGLPVCTTASSSGMVSSALVYYTMFPQAAWSVRTQILKSGAMTARNIVPHRNLRAPFREHEPCRWSYWQATGTCSEPSCNLWGSRSTRTKRACSAAIEGERLARNRDRGQVHWWPTINVRDCDRPKRGERALRWRHCSWFLLWRNRPTASAGWGFVCERKAARRRNAGVW